MAALGFNVTAHRIAAYTFAAVIAAIAGVLLVWLNSQISPGTAGIGPVIDILVIAVVGGLGRPIGPFVGALIYVVLRTFALDALVAVGLDGARFQLLIGIGFLAIVLFSPDGVLGLCAIAPASAGSSAEQPARAGRRRPVMATSVAERLHAAGTANALELRGVTRMFGALAALDDVTLSGPARRAPRGARLERRRQDHAVQLRHRRLPADLGHDPLLRRGHHRLPAARADPPRSAPHLSDLAAVRRPLGARQRLSRLPRRLARPLLAAPPAPAATRWSRPRVDLVEAVHLTAVKDQKVAELAHGQQRQLEIALALSGAPRFILFDEPAAGLSPTERRELSTILTGLPGHIGYIIIEHDMDVALRVVESVTMMHNGRIFKEGPPEEIENDPEVQELYLGGGHG